jgi:agmatine/peptidylarginine deiminase|tara:strand:+ start:155 stop:484 length:330 start_codon:yes stop_codon:yes gene_type:complete
MSEFFKSEIVQEELQEINELQTEIYSNMVNIQNSGGDEKEEHIDKLTRLLELQRMMYTRVSLSEDPEAKAMKKQLEQSVTMLGFPEGTDISVLFEGMQNTIQSLKDRID